VKRNEGTMAPTNKQASMHQLYIDINANHFIIVMIDYTYVCQNKANAVNAAEAMAKPCHKPL